MAKRIDSPKNPLIKRIRKLQTKSKFRGEEKCYIVEGYKQVDELPLEKIQLIVLSKEEDMERYSHLADKAVFIDEQLFREISTDQSPQGVLALVAMKQVSFYEHQVNPSGLYLALDGIQDPGNLGTMIRVADAVGATGIILGKDCVDLYNPKVVKSTKGALEHVDVFRVDDLAEALALLGEKGIVRYGAYLDDSRYHYDYDYSAGGTCFVIGNEGNGISEEVINVCDYKVKIPMPGSAESLNASIAASVLLYEALRQRMQ